MIYFKRAAREDLENAFKSYSKIDKKFDTIFYTKRVSGKLTRRV